MGMTMRTLAILLLLTALSGTPVVAGPCEDDLKIVDKALKSDAAAPDVKAQAKDMRAQAADLCKAGNAQEAADVLAEAKAMLNAE
jgi:hypothetical protein